MSAAPVFLEVTDVQELLGLGRRTVWYHTNSGRLRNLRIPGTSVTRWHAKGLVRGAGAIPRAGIWGPTDVSRALRISTTLTYRLAQEGHLPFTKRLGSWSVNTRRLRAWVDEHSWGQHDPDLLERRGVDTRPRYFEASLDNPSVAVLPDLDGQR